MPTITDMAAVEISGINSGTRHAYGEIIREILAHVDSGIMPDRSMVRRIVFDACSRHGLPRVPKNYEILSFAAACGGVAECDCSDHYDTGDNNHNTTDAIASSSGRDCSIPAAAHTPVHMRALRTVLLKKPAKTASGVAVVAIMPKPFACPHGRCTYCPGGPEYNTPNSYTGAEPPALDAIKHSYDPIPQIRTKLEHLEAFGHDTSKTEIVIVGGTFLFMPRKYREDFVKSCYDALNGTSSAATMRDAQNINERAATRNVGFTIETKPDYCKEQHIDDMLSYGVTRVEIGIQSLRDRVYRHVNRGHTYCDVVESFGLAKDAGYKIAAHMMPGLPTMTPADDIADFARLYEDSDLRPDMLKIYPSLVIRGTPLYDEYKSGKYVPYSDHDMINVLAEAKKLVPKWVRIMRVQREIPPSQIVAGPKQGNLRQLVRKRLAEQGTPCKCIRCREAGLSDNDTIPAVDDLKLDVMRYDSSGGKEVFISYEDDSERIYGFVRLRKPSSGAHRPELADGTRTCIIRELHVYGRVVGVGSGGSGGKNDVCRDNVISEDAQNGPAALQPQSRIQHMGLGRSLMANAEKIARTEFGARRMLVTSAVGTRPYYQRLGYSLYGPYMAKKHL